MIVVEVGSPFVVSKRSAYLYGPRHWYLAVHTPYVLLLIEALGVVDRYLAFIITTVSTHSIYDTALGYDRPRAREISRIKLTHQGQ